MPFNSVKRQSSFKLGFPGNVADGAPHYIRSYAVELTASQDFTAGAPMLLGTDPSSQARPTVAGDTLSSLTFAGFGVDDPTKTTPNSGVQYSNGDPVGILKLGVLIVSCSAAVTAGQAVVAQVNGGTLRSSNITGSLATGEFFVPGARWLDSAPIGGVAALSVGMGGVLHTSTVTGVSGAATLTVVIP